MNRAVFQKQWIALIVLGMLQAIRLLLIAEDGGTSFLDVFFMLVIWVFSIGWLLLTVFNLRHPIKELFRSHPDAWLFALYLLLMELLFLIKIGMMPTRIYPFSLLLAFSGTAVLTLLLKPKARRIFQQAFMVFLAIYLMGQDVYFRIFNDFFSFKEAPTLREGLESGETAFRLNGYYFLVLFMLFVFLLIYRKLASREAKPQFRWLMPLVLIPLMLFNMHIPKAPYRALSSELYLYQTVFHKQTFVEAYGSLHLLYRDAFDSLVPPIGTKRDKAKIENHIQALNRTRITHEFSGVFEGKNIVFILAESYDEMALSSELTPNIYRMKTEGIDFTNHYTPVFPRTTSDTEFIINVGLIPSIEQGPTIIAFKNNSYRTSLPNLFAEKGYITRAFHGNYKEFYGRHIVYPNYGYHTFYGQHELQLNQHDKKVDTLFYASTQTIARSNQQPFFDMYITFSGHSPYNQNNPAAVLHADTVRAFYPELQSETLIYYIATQVEVDHMLGMLMDDLTAANQLKDTVIVFMGDHYPYTMPDEDYAIIYGSLNLHQRHHGNLYIWSEDMTHHTVTKLTSSFDVLPTLAEMFNLSYNPNHYTGVDAFSLYPSYVYFKDYVVYNGSKFIHLADRNETDDALLEKAFDAYLFSKRVLRTNSFRK